MSEPNEGSQTRAVMLRVNGTEYRGQVEVRKLLVDFLREDLGLRALRSAVNTASVGCVRFSLKVKPPVRARRWQFGQTEWS